MPISFRLVAAQPADLLRAGEAGAFSEFWQGDIAEVLVYNRELSSIELQQAWSSLQGKYGIQEGLAKPSNYYKFAANVGDSLTIGNTQLRRMAQVSS